MDVLYSRCCGIDVHKQTAVACVVVQGPSGRPTKEIRTFGTMTDELLALADWLEASGVTHVAMESTGVYWKPLVRREALFDREGMKGPLPQTVAAVC
jgi:transposase